MFNVQKDFFVFTKQTKQNNEKNSSSPDVLTAEMNQRENLSTTNLS